MPNLQDAMENDGLNSTVPSLSSSVNPSVGSLSMNHMGNAMGTPMNASIENSMATGNNLFSLNDSLHSMRNKELSPSFNGLSRSLAPSGGSFMLTSFGNDYGSHCAGARTPSLLVSNPSLTTSAGHTSSFAPMTPMNPLYLDNNSLMGDYPSDAGYSPMPASPYYNEDLSPRRLFPSSSNSRLLMTSAPLRQPVSG